MENSAYLALPLFAGLAAGDIPAALAALDALCRPFAKGETLLEAGQRGAPMGVVLAGLSTKVLPQTMHRGAIQPTGIMAGKFQGAMPANTPRGSR